MTLPAARLTSCVEPALALGYYGPAKQHLFQCHGFLGWALLYELEAWLARQFSLKPETSTAIVTDISRSVHLYFRGSAVTAAITALVGSIFILYFLTSFTPYLGAWIGSVFLP